ncbi:MAG TPA: RDD family protein [Acidimicrobiia bacterium]
MKEIRSERSREAQGQRAGFVSQAIGAGLDAAAIFALDFAALAVFGFLRFLLTDKSYAFPQPGPFLNFVILFVIGVALLWTAWSGSGRAPGMAVLGLRVVGRDGRRLSSRRAFWRAVLGVLTLGLGVLWVLVSKKNKSLYDIVCGSAVVYDWRASLPTGLPDSRQNQ